MYEFLQYRTSHVMTREPRTIGPDTPLAEAEAIFDQNDFNALPVLDGDERLVGILTKLDLLAAFTFTSTSKIPRYDELMHRPAAEQMTRELTTVDPDLPLTRVLQMLVETRNKSFPVVDGDRLIGIIAREDVLGALRRAAQGERPSP